MVSQHQLWLDADTQFEETYPTWRKKLITEDYKNFHIHWSIWSGILSLDCGQCQMLQMDANNLFDTFNCIESQGRIVFFFFIDLTNGDHLML